MFYFLLYVNRQNCSCLLAMRHTLKVPLISNVAAVYSFDSFYESITYREASQSQIETCSNVSTSTEGR